MKKALTVAVIIELILFGLAINKTQAQSFQNPIINEDAPDPTCIKARDGYYYLYATGAKTFKSADMIHWQRLDNFFTQEGRPSFVRGVRYIWAPDINYINGQYVMYYALSKWGGEDSCGIGAAYSKTPQGPYTNINGNGKLFRSFEIGVRNSIDPFYIKDHGRNWLMWGSFSGIYAAELSKDGLSLKEPDKNPIQIAGKAYEGTYIYKRKGYYYFFGSIGSCCEGAKSTYKTVVARSKKLLGPYVDKSGRPLLEDNHEILLHGNNRWAGTGHNAELIRDKKGRTWMPYHAYDMQNPKKGRVVLLDEVKWDKDGWPYVERNQPATHAEADF